MVIKTPNNFCIENEIYVFHNIRYFFRVCYPVFERMAFRYPFWKVLIPIFVRKNEDIIQ